MTDKLQLRRAYEITNSLESKTLREAAEFLLSKIEIYGEEARIYTDVRDCYGDVSAIVNIEYTSEETDNEYNTRINRIKEAEQREKEQYERLKKKFG